MEVLKHLRHVVPDYQPHLITLADTIWYGDLMDLRNLAETLVIWVKVKPWIKLFVD